MKLKSVTKEKGTEIKIYLGVNPFIRGFVIPVNKITIKNQYKSSGETDNEGNIIFEDVVVTAEATPFTKFYITSENRKIRNGLSLRAKELLLWLMDELEPGLDYIKVNKQRYMKELNIKSVNTYKEAIKDLVRYDMIAFTVQPNIFWINPEYIFRGDRLKKYPNKLSVKEKAADKEEYSNSEELNKTRPCGDYEKEKQETF